MESKPFQFSMRRLFLAVALFCIAAWAVSRPVSDVDGLPISVLMIGAALAAATAAVGTLFGKSLDGLAVGFAVCTLVGILTCGLLLFVLKSPFILVPSP
jgi:hypothetical protein